MQLESKLRIIIVSISITQVRESNPRSLFCWLICFHDFWGRLYRAIVIIGAVSDIVIEIRMRAIFYDRWGGACVNSII
jgi:hypothetical protein